MKASKLIKLLEKHPNWEVVMSKDSEGNGFSPLAEIGEQLYVPDSTWSGEVHSLDEAEHLGKEAKEAFVLWPTN
jgi:hypothetical protein